jgi:hypothetical protein
VLRSKGGEMVRRAIPSMRKERVFLTFGKSQPRRNHSVTSNPTSSSSHPLPWSPNPSARSFNHHLPRPNSNPKHYGFVTTLPEVAQPIFVPAPPVVTPAPVAVPVAAPLMQAASHPLVPGTGVFLPPPPPSMNGLPENFQASDEPNGTSSESKTVNAVITKDEVKHGEEGQGTAEGDSKSK